MASTHASQRRLKFAIEFAAIGQQEIEGWLSYFEAMDVNELGAARARRPATRGHCTSMSAVTQVSSKEVLDYLGFRDSKFMHAAFQLLGEPWDGSRMDFGETVKCIAQFCMRARGVPRRFHFTDTTRGHLTSMRVVSFSSLSCFGPRRGRLSVSERALS